MDKIESDAPNPANHLSPLKNEIHTVNNNNPSIALESSYGKFGTDDFSISFWFNTKSKSRLFDIIGNREQGSHGNFICVRMTGKHDSIDEGKLCIEIDQDGNGLNYVGMQSKRGGYNDGEWHHVTVIRSKLDLILFVDGEEIIKESTKGVTDLTGQYTFKLGRSYSGFEAPEISFYDLKFHFYPLSGSEINEIYSVKPPL